VAQALTGEKLERCVAMLPSNGRVAATLATLTDHTVMANVGDTSQPKQRLEWSSLLNHNRAMASQVSLTSHEKLSVSLHTRFFEIAISALILFNLGLVVRETDLAARDEEEPLWMQVLNFALVCTFLLEVLVRLYVYRSELLRDWSNILDIVLVVADVTLGTVDLVNRLEYDGERGTFSVSVLRVFRMSVRVLRALRTAAVFSQVNVLIQGFAKALETIVWGLAMIGLMLIVWSVLAVQLIHPITKDAGYMDGDYWNVFESVWQSSLTLFGFAIFGDGWSEVVMPLIREEGWPVAFFLGVLISVSFAMLNLILSAIVDNAATAREQESHLEAMALDQRLRIGKRQLVETCRSMDVNGNGTLSAEELLQGMEKRPEFKEVLRKMGITDADLETVFRMLDVENSQEMGYEAFADQLHRVKSQGVRSLESQLTLSMVTDLHKQVREMKRVIDSSTPAAPTAASAKVHFVESEPSPSSQSVMEGVSRQQQVSSAAQAYGGFNIDSLRSATDELLTIAERSAANTLFHAVEDALWQSMSAKGYVPAWRPSAAPVSANSGRLAPPSANQPPGLVRITTNKSNLSALQHRVLAAAGFDDDLDTRRPEGDSSPVIEPVQPARSPLRALARNAEPFPSPSSALPGVPEGSMN